MKRGTWVNSLVLIPLLITMASGQDGGVRFQFPAATPEHVGMDEAKLAEARDYALRGGGSGCILRGGRLVMTWMYSDGGPNWLADCLTVAYGRDLLDVMTERVFQPLGITVDDIPKDGDQHGDGARGKKASGLLCVDGILYLWVRNAEPGTGRQSQLAWSADHGRTWQWSEWKFAEFGYPCFLNYGRNYASARDEFVYVYSPDTPSAYYETDQVTLMRVPKGRIRDRDAYEFFKELDPPGEPVWTSNLRERGVAFRFPGGCNRMDVTWNAGLRRYLLVMRSRPKMAADAGLPNTSRADAVNQFSIFDAPEPWGPWTTVYYTEQWEGTPLKDLKYWQGWGESARLPAKWMSTDGKTVHLVFAGGLGGFSVRRAELTIATAPNQRASRARTPRLEMARSLPIKEVELYHWVDFSIEASGAAAGIGKWDVEGSCLWTHENGAVRRTSLLWYSGSGDTYVYRFGGSLPGRWIGRTSSPVAALDGLELTVEVMPSSNPNRIGWSGQRSGEPTAWAHQKGPDGELVKCTPILIMMPDVQRWFNDLPRMRAFMAEFHNNHGFNGGHISTIGRGWFEVGSTDSLRTAPTAPDVRTFAALEAAASEWSERGGWLHLWMWGKGGSGDFSNLPGGYNGAQSRRINRYVAARLGPVPGWSMGLGWDVEFWVDETKLKWWLDDLVPQLGGWYHWIGHRYSDSDIGQGRDPEPANKGEYLSRGVSWNTLRSGSEQYAGWEHWFTMTSDSEIDAGLAAAPDRPMMSEDRFRQRESNWPQKDLRSDDAILKEIPRWATRGVAAIYGRFFDSSDGGSDPWPNKAAIKAVIESIDE